MNEQELRAEFEREWGDEFGWTPELFQINRRDAYYTKIFGSAFAMYKRAKLQSEQRIAELEAQTQWQPIKTAPRKGFFLVCEEDGDQYVASHHSHNWWCYGQSDDGEPMFCMPAHWMPLPPPPESEDKDKS